MKIHYISGSRADFGLMCKTLQTLEQSDIHDVGVVVTGQHCIGKYGNSIDDIRHAGLKIVAKIPVELSGAGGLEMGLAMANELTAMLNLWSIDRPDLVLLLGDRGETLAGALAAVHLGIHVAHIHGGERSGTLDESFRHAISKLCHFHFPATEESRDRLISMGESPDQIWVLGAPGLVGLTENVISDRAWFSKEFGLPKDKPIALVIFHPVVQEADRAYEQMRTIVDSLLQCDCALLLLRPNSDAGGSEIDRYIDGIKYHESISVRTHLQRDVYVKALASCDFLLGNSSSGIVESASFGIPCVNIGSRQKNRERNSNIIDCPDITDQNIIESIDEALNLKGPFTNAYGDGRADANLMEILGEIELNYSILNKCNSY